MLFIANAICWFARKLNNNNNNNNSLFTFPFLHSITMFSIFRDKEKKLDSCKDTVVYTEGLEGRFSKV